MLPEVAAWHKFRAMLQPIHQILMQLVFVMLHINRRPSFVHIASSDVSPLHCVKIILTVLLPAVLIV